MDPELIQLATKIQDALDHLKKELSSIRAGRANPSLLEEIPINAYGAQMKLMEVGTISTPQFSLLTVQVWDMSILDNVIKAIQQANLGLNPSNEGGLIRLPIPPLTAERREEFIRIVHQKQEEVHVAIRQIRQDIRNEWKKEQESGQFGEDEFFRRERILQELIDKKVAEIEGLGKAKKEELTQI